MEIGSLVTWLLGSGFLLSLFAQSPAQKICIISVDRVSLCTPVLSNDSSSLPMCFNNGSLLSKI